MKLPFGLDNGPDGTSDPGYHFYPFRDSSGFRARRVLLPPTFFSGQSGRDDADFRDANFDSYSTALSNEFHRGDPVTPLYEFYDDVLIRPASRPASASAMSELSDAMLDALHRPRRASHVRIITPINNTVVPLSQSEIAVRVAFTDYKSPADGMWCVVVQGVETNCAGDSSEELVVPLPAQKSGGSSSTAEWIEIRVVLRDHFRKLHEEFDTEDMNGGGVAFGGGHLRHRDAPVIVLRQNDAERVQL